ncbi:hypothetical protein H4Q26_001999 [Puccinia striiformis f. sp. tritici PST-130]|nr:hypothetical protein H4Q26_001999 [Puccinia striiformis f. sp. tritici PST-130]
MTVFNGSQESAMTPSMTVLNGSQESAFTPSMTVLNGSQHYEKIGSNQPHALSALASSPLSSNAAAQTTETFQPLRA